MKTIETTVEVPVTPASTRVDTQYVCDAPGCDYSTEDEDAARGHHACEHAVKERRTVVGQRCYRFDTEVDFDAYARAQEGEEADLFLGQWRGPGWYVAVLGYRRCSRNCCNKSTLMFQPAAEFAAARRERARALLAEADGLDALDAAGAGGGR